MSTRLRYYRLNGETLETFRNVSEWVEWFEHADHCVNKTIVDDYEVSTIFLGIDHNYFSTGPPLLFETMVFGGPLDRYQRRYTTYEEALKGHDETVRLAETGEEPPEC